MPITAWLLAAMAGTEENKMTTTMNIERTILFTIPSSPSTTIVIQEEEQTLNDVGSVSLFAPSYPTDHLQAAVQRPRLDFFGVRGIRCTLSSFCLVSGGYTICVGFNLITRYH